MALIHIDDLKRPHPTESELERRKRHLSELRDLIPVTPSSPSPKGLAPGNSKTGISGTFFATVFVWNLPAVASCLGASEWCLTHCYNADPRTDVFPIHEWTENWYWAKHHPERLSAQIKTQLAQAAHPTAVRVHSSGDFFSIDYVNFWRRLAEEHTSIAFWAYTRSWANPELLLALSELERMPNVHLFASWDQTMPPPPQGWRRAYVVDTIEALSSVEDSFGFLPCPEQVQALPNCASCGFCIRRDSRSVGFLLH